MAEHHQRGGPTAIHPESVGHAADLGPVLRNLAGFDCIPFAHLHARGARGLFDRPSPLWPCFAEQAAEHIAPGLAAELGGAAAVRRMLSDSHILMLLAKSSRQEEGSHGFSYELSV